VVDQLLLGELEALGLTAAGFLDRAALLAMAGRAIHDRVGRDFVFLSHF
jgi:hypothetical protein